MKLRKRNWGRLPVGVKTCNRCDLPKRPWDFYGNRANPDGLQAICKLCNTSVQQEKDRRRRYKNMSVLELRVHVDDLRQDLRAVQWALDLKLRDRYQASESTL